MAKPTPTHTFCDNCKRPVKAKIVYQQQGAGGGVIMDVGEFSVFAHRQKTREMKVCPECGWKVRNVYTKADQEVLRQRGEAVAEMEKVALWVLGIIFIGGPIALVIYLISAK